ncbi:MAG: hypothetical protein SO004_12975, partial [Blautia sp.]|nr:hypothetical protein [Blautia sp.]
MKRIFYGIGFFFAAFFLICGFLMSYQIAGLQEQLKELEEESTKMGKQVSALPLSKNSSLIFEIYNPDSGEMEKNTYRIFSYSEPTAGGLPQRVLRMAGPCRSCLHTGGE